MTPYRSLALLAALFAASALAAATPAAPATPSVAEQVLAPVAPPTAEQLAVHVLNRLAYGPRPGDVERVTQMGVQRYIDSQLANDPAALPYPPALNERLRTLGAANRAAGDVLGEFVVLRQDVKNEEEGAKQKRRAGVARIALETDQARLLRAIDSPRQLEEVMVDFWYNHFNVFAGKGVDRALIASYERDAIRPYVFGNFRELLGATAKHPAMLYYLDNHLSTAANYQPVKRMGRRGQMSREPVKNTPHGLNENYARELMELHTLGVNGGYSQKDVTELARMLTGWSYEQRDLIRANQGFHFALERHDKGDKLWLGRNISAHGQSEGEQALDVLAQHPATAHHISFKLAQYFVQDQPPPALVERMAQTFLDSHGDIRAVLRTLFGSAEFVAPGALGAKFKTPYQFVISAARASAAPLSNISPLLGTMSQLGMPLYGCQTPDGYKNTEAAWLNPDALSRRISFASALAGGKLTLAAPQTLKGQPAQSAPGEEVAVMAPLDAQALQTTLGAAISPRTRAAVAARPAPLRAALLLGSPDFMQR